MALIRLDFANLDKNSRLLDELLPRRDMKIWAGQIMYYIEHTIQVPPEFLNPVPIQLPERTVIAFLSHIV